MGRGPLGFPVVDVAVTLIDGSFHAVDSSELAFRIAGRMAMGEALEKAASYLLEPIVRVTVDTPAGTGSKAGSVLSARRGQILGLSQHPEWSRWERVEALLPESGLHGLDAELRSLSQGLASSYPPQMITAQKAPMSALMITGSKPPGQTIQAIRAVGRAPSAMAFSSQRKGAPWKGRTWVDSMGSGIMNGTGELSADGKTETWSFTYNCPVTKKPTVMREILHHTSPTTMTVEFHMVDPKSGKEYKGMEHTLTKSK